MEEGNFIRITPFIHVPDLVVAVKFFEDLGFTTYFRMDNYAYVQRECAGVRMLQAQEAIPEPRGYAYYIDVNDVEALFAELAPVLAANPHYLKFGLQDQDYLQREFGLLAPDGNLLVFGQDIRS